MINIVGFVASMTILVAAVLIPQTVGYRWAESCPQRAGVVRVVEVVGSVWFVGCVVVGGLAARVGVDVGWLFVVGGVVGVAGWSLGSGFGAGPYRSAGVFVLEPGVPRRAEVH